MNQRLIEMIRGERDNVSFEIKFVYALKNKWSIVSTKDDHFQILLIHRE